MNELTVVLLVALLAWQDLHNRRERQKLIEAVMAKSLPELKASEAKQGRQAEQVLPEFTPIETASEAAFDLAIKKQLGRLNPLEKAKDKLQRMVKKNG